MNFLLNIKLESEVRQHGARSPTTSFTVNHKTLICKQHAPFCKMTTPVTFQEARQISGYMGAVFLRCEILEAVTFA